MDKVNIIKTIKPLLYVFCILAIFQSCNWDNNKDLGYGFVYYPDNELILSTDGKFGEIPSTIIDYKYDSDFVVAMQKPREGDPNIRLYDYTYTYELGYDVVYYWIILKEQKKIIGPMTRVEFTEARKKYNVSESLILN